MFGRARLRSLVAGRRSVELCLQFGAVGERFDPFDNLRDSVVERVACVVVPACRTE